MEIKLEDIKKKYNNLKVIENFNMSFSSDKVHCIFGPSGCGKSTLLNIITGIITSYSGKIEGMEDKSFSYVFQENRLLPWLSVEGNIMFVLESNYSKREAEKISEKYIDLVKLSKFKNNFPRELSGGMKQRVSIARALAYNGDIIVMDEPFKGLDMELKTSLMNFIVNHCKYNNKLFIYTTHDTFEAAYMADNIYVFEGPPLKIKKYMTIDIPFEERCTRISEVKNYEEILKNRDESKEHS
ncbi:ABC transporter ATP-binding protein [Clostridium guangxiense]|uniref:ABC transporter ATP-binding protein n=2 Tax=Clostridium TaxID=1485 RepID=UPI001E5339B0|nr:ATP-binding cassette domain-containing protein [Clostridium guangxiense]MCD2345525.1 ATP-binding cassette domain-containing protein [Clostridium guangxiense]